MKALTGKQLVLAEWEGTRILPRDVVDVAVLRVLVTCGVLQKSAQETVARLDEMEDEDFGVGFDGVPDGRLRHLLGRDTT